MRSRRSPQRHAGFIILFGTRTIVSRDDREPAKAACPQCRQQTQMIPMKSRQWFTLFFIPVLPLSKGKPICQCQSCGAQFYADIDALRQARVESDSGALQHAIGLFNDMREAPHDPVRLHQMMSAYCALGEFREAVNSARHFPVALQSSEACMVLMAQACSRIGDHAQARLWSEQALAKAPASASAREVQREVSAASLHA
jgi:hypothetical protein